MELLDELNFYLKLFNDFEVFIILFIFNIQLIATPK